MRKHIELALKLLAPFNVTPIKAAKRELRKAIKCFPPSVEIKTGNNIGIHPEVMIYPNSGWVRHGRNCEWPKGE